MDIKIINLIQTCKNELLDRQYSVQRLNKFIYHWCNFADWLESIGISEVSEESGNKYCDIHIGTHLLKPHMSVADKNHLRAIRMLVTYKKYGDFEFRSPRVEYVFNGILGSYIKEYLQFQSENRSYRTVEAHRIVLMRFYNYMNKNEFKLSDICMETIEKFLYCSCCSSNSKYEYANVLRQFLHFLYMQNYTDRDYSILVLPQKRYRNRQIATTYTEEEIRKMINAINRASAKGKRDYLIVLLAAEYGWRASDIVRFCFSHIDWDNNKIRFWQYKTNIPVEYPLLASVGNAIIDYLKYGRPVSNRHEIIISAEKAKHGTPLKTPTIHSIVGEYLKKANITGWKNKKHGPHSLRHSLATNLLKKNVSLPIISSVLGHQNTESTRLYLKLDIEKLRLCTLPMPALESFYYIKEEYTK